MNALLTSIKEATAEILDDASDIEVANHASHGKEYVTIADMANPLIARNNCWAASNEIYENLELEAYADMDTVDIIGVTATGLSHYAVYLANGDEQVVLDFTARQFSPDAPFPMVMPATMWHAYMKHVTEREDLVLAVTAD